MQAGLLGGAERLARRADGLVGLLGVLDLLVVPAGAARHVLGTVEPAGLVPGRFEGLGRQGGRVGPHVGDEPVLVQALGDLHGPGRREAQLAARLLLERRGHERGVGRAAVGTLLDRADRRSSCRPAASARPVAAASSSAAPPAPWWRASRPRRNPCRWPAGSRRPRPGRRRTAPYFPRRRCRRCPSSEAARKRMRARSRSTSRRVATRLHPAGREPGHHLLPQDRRHLVAVEAVEDAAGLLGVDQAAVQLPPLPHGPLDRRPGDLVEDHALDRHPGGQDLEQVPGDGLALAVLVRRQVQLAGPLQEVLELPDLVFLLPGDDVERLEVVVDVDAEAGPGLALVGSGDVGRVPRQVPDVADRGFDDVVAPKEAGDGLGLGG